MSDTKPIEVEPSWELLAAREYLKGECGDNCWRPDQDKDLAELIRRHADKTAATLAGELESIKARNFANGIRYSELEAERDAGALEAEIESVVKFK